MSVGSRVIFSNSLNASLLRQVVSINPFGVKRGKGKAWDMVARDNNLENKKEKDIEGNTAQKHTKASARLPDDGIREKG